MNKENVLDLSKKTSAEKTRIKNLIALIKDYNLQLKLSKTFNEKKRSTDLIEMFKSELETLTERPAVFFENEKNEIIF